jgi:hypothetical protein
VVDEALDASAFKQIAQHTDLIISTTSSTTASCRGISCYRCYCSSTVPCCSAAGSCINCSGQACLFLCLLLLLLPTTKLPHPAAATSAAAYRPLLLLLHWCQ